MKRKTTSKKLQVKLLLVLLAMIPIISFAQPNTQHWKLGGNPLTGIDAVNGTNNIFGTIPNLPINIVTNGIQRIHINENIGTTSGFVGIGTNFLGPNHLLDVFNGDINTGNGTPASPSGYMIGDNYVLRHT